jgi:hypothetical protein
MSLMRLFYVNTDCSACRERHSNTVTGMADRKVYIDSSGKARPAMRASAICAVSINADTMWRNTEVCAEYRPRGDDTQREQIPINRCVIRRATMTLDAVEHIYVRWSKGRRTRPPYLADPWN